MLISADCCILFLRKKIHARYRNRQNMRETSGRENGKKCVVIDVMDEAVLVTGPKKVTGVKRRRVNINHVMPLQDKVRLNVAHQRRSGSGFRRYRQTAGNDSTCKAA